MTLNLSFSSPMFLNQEKESYKTSCDETNYIKVVLHWENDIPKVRTEK